MTETKKLLHADVETGVYVYEIEETPEHLTVARLTQDDGGSGWRYAVTARRLGAASDDDEGAEVAGEGSDFATPDEALAAARTHARNLLAG